jgi:APA family basic amino acid/polyamine antiporter/amino acid efflux transporter
MESERRITLFGGVSIAISMVVGSGLFGLPGLVIQTTGPFNALAGWLAVIVIMPSMIYIFSYLGQRYPATGGIALYAARGFGEWSKGGILLLTSGTLLIGMPAFFMVGGSYLASLFHLDAGLWGCPLAVLLAIFSTTINVIGIRQMGWMNSFAVALIMGIIVFVVIRTMPEIWHLHHLPHAAPNQQLSFSNIWLAASIVFWAFQGWENLTFGFGEIKNPARNIPRIFWVSFAVVAISYLLFAISVSISALSGLQVQGLNGLVAFLPSGAFGTLTLIIMVSILVANANSWVFGASRAFLASAKGGMLPKLLAYETRRQVPVASLLCALAAYCWIIGAFYLFKIDPKYAFLITTQGFIILYGGSILGFIRETKGLKDRLATLLALVGWVFLVQGFRLLILYPVIWFALGVLLSLRPSGSAAKGAIAGE